MYKKYFFILNVCKKIIINKKKLLITILNSARFFAWVLNKGVSNEKYLYSVLFSFALISFSHSVHADDHHAV